MRHIGIAVAACCLAFCAGCSGDPEPEAADLASSELTSGTLSGTLKVSSDWGAGYCADLTLKNSGTSSVTWSATVNLGTGKLTQSWNSTATVSGSQVKFVGVSFNAKLAAGASTGFGFCADGTGSRGALSALGGGGTSAAPAPTPTSTTPPAPTSTTPPPPPSGLVPRCAYQVVPKKGQLTHPGGSVGSKELAELWSSSVMGSSVRKPAVERLKIDVNAVLAGSPRVRTTLNGDNAEDSWPMSEDGQAIYGLALLFEITCDPAYAKRAQALADAWAVKFQGFTTTPGNKYTGVPLRSAWGIIPMARGVELLARTYRDWDPNVTLRFRKMVDTYIQPALATRRPGATGQCWLNNWHTAVNQAWFQIAYLKDSRGMFDEAVADWKRMVDGRPVTCPDTRDKTKLVSGTDAYLAWDPNILRSPADRGTTTEACRDAWHSHVGLHSMVDAAEMAWHEGVDLYAYKANLVRDAVEVHARGYVNRSNASFTDYYTGGNHGDSSLYVGYRNVCRYPRTANGTNENWGSVPGTFEMAYRHYVGRRGLTMGQTQKLLSERRPQGRNTSWGWDTVTHAK